jgi:integrase
MKNPTTVGIYLRPLRHIFNLAMDHPSDFLQDYPFKRKSHETNKYKIPAPRNIKKALTKVEVKSIYEYKALEGSPEAFYKDIWLFSYFANGINMKDICKLKYKNIKGVSIEFRRAKTERSNKNTKPITIVLTEDLIKIIDEYGTKPNAKENYIFTFLKPTMNLEDEMAAIKQATKQTNKYIKKVAKNLKINAEVSTYTARHTFATILKNAGVAPSFIGECMGHASQKTIESYLGSFESDQRKDNINKLKDW